MHGLDARRGRPPRRRRCRRARARRRPRTSSRSACQESRSAGDAEAEHQDHEDRRDAAEEIGVRDRQHAEREEDGAGQAPRTTASSSASARMNGSAMQKIFTFSRTRARSPGSRRELSARRRTGAWNSGQPGELTTAKPSAVKTTTVLATAMTTPRRPSLRRRFAKAVYCRTGTLTTFESQVVWIRFSVPLRLQRRERLVHARAERVALLEDHPEVLAGRGRRTARGSSSSAPGRR